MQGDGREEAEESGQAAERQAEAERGEGQGDGARTAWQDGASITVRVNRSGTGNLTAGGLLCWSIGSARATSRRHEINFSELNRPHHRYGAGADPRPP